LAAFYLKRSDVAGQIGRVEQQLDDVRAAAKHAADARLSYREFRDILRALAFAEAAAGNFNSAIDALRRAIAIQTDSIASNEIAARLSARGGDLPSARTFETVVAGASWSLYRTDPFKRWDDPFERWRIPLAKVWVRHGEGRGRGADAEMRAALRLMDGTEPREGAATAQDG